MSSRDISKKPLGDDTIIINPGKILNNSNAGEMLETITALQAESYKYIIIDMNELEFLSSAGVGSILSNVETSREAGGDIVLCNISDNILHVFKVLDLASYMTIRTNIQEAAGFCGIEK
ncbi:MAG: STAS domain-containing protein [candidate division Zixibacteria bacterium]|nr:STAS domain-containing protein [candidate division Zixibacteria bacterium]